MSVVAHQGFSQPEAARQGVTARPAAAAPLPAAVRELLDRAEAGLQHAGLAADVGERYVGAHLAGLRAAAAVLAARTSPMPRSRPRSVWQVLPTVAPELTEWAAFFAASGRRRAVVERGDRVVCAREADDLVRQAEVFVQLVHDVLGLTRVRSMAHGQFLVPLSSFGAVS